MNKQELIDAVAESTGGTKSTTGEIIDAIIAAVTGAVTRATVQTDRLRIVFDRCARRARRTQSGNRRRDFRLPPRRR